LLKAWWIQLKKLARKMEMNFQMTKRMLEVINKEMAVAGAGSIEIARETGAGNKTELPSVGEVSNSEGSSKNFSVFSTQHKLM